MSKKSYIPNGIPIEGYCNRIMVDMFIICVNLTYVS